MQGFLKFHKIKMFKVGKIGQQQFLHNFEIFHKFEIHKIDILLF